MTIGGLSVLHRAHSYLRTVALDVPEDAWGARTPCDQWTARQVLNHARLAQDAYTAVIAEAGGVSLEPVFAPEDALPPQHTDVLGDSLDGLRATLADLPAGLAEVPTPMGPMPPSQAACCAAFDAAVHAWDIAVATGQRLPLEDDLADGLRPAARFLVGPLRELGMLAPPRTDHPAGPGAELLAATGRDANWIPTQAAYAVC
ncbi:TIGR03086 family metal-binding protein [Streptomyces sp. IBSBF 2435]|uniref:TIGR03086 family metal-binding protein n=1 Tax=Streptomyces sp. IBSBF 2435 TaxID=2903531 RepID=UPI002FDBCCED